jgi:hypothetical protein
MPVENIPGIVKAIPGSGENRSPSRRNHCSPSARKSRSPSPRNRFHVHPGILFAFARNPHYTLTAAGRKQLASETREFDRLIGAIHTVLRST